MAQFSRCFPRVYTTDDRAASAIFTSVGSGNDFLDLFGISSTFLRRIPSILFYFCFLIIYNRSLTAILDYCSCSTRVYFNDSQKLVNPTLIPSCNMLLLASSIVISGLSSARFAADSRFPRFHGH